MADYKLPPSGGDFGDYLARLGTASEKLDELNRKDRQRQQIEEETTSVERATGRTRGDLAGATEQLSAALTANVGALERETAAVWANVGALRAKLEITNQLARNSVASTESLAGPSVAPTESLAVTQARLAALQREREIGQRSAYWGAQDASAYLATVPGPRGDPLPASAGLPPSVAFVPGRQPIALLPEHAESSYDRVRQRIDEQGQYVSRGAAPREVAPPTDAQAAYDAEVLRARQGLSGLAVAQGEANQAFQLASANYASASNALSRHGALTTEFIQALARGQVTLSEFGSQVTSTIGKFGGWVVAGAAIYGVYDALKHVYDGARDTQGAVQNLGRFLPGLGGPAGGGSGQVGVAQQQLRDISVQFNVPIKEVGDAAQVLARTFHTVTDTMDATRAALAAQTLDQVPLAQSEQYLVGIANTMGFTRGSQVIGVVDQLNQLQASYGVRVSQSLPGLARAVPSAQASGVELPQLEALVGLGVRAGVSGNQIGTALVRSMTNFAFRPSNAPVFGQFGITPQIGQYGKLADQVMEAIDTGVRTGEVNGHPFSGRTLTALASALGGPSLGGRSILPILEQEALHPGIYQGAIAKAQDPRSYQEDLSANLGSVSERFKSIGIQLAAFGSELGNVALTPIIGLLDVVHRTVGVFELLLSPVAQMSHIFSSLPGPLRDLLGILVALRIARAVGASSLGGAAQSYVGRLPGLGAFGNRDREIVDDSVNRLQNYILPEQQRESANALGRVRAATQTAALAQARIGDLQRENPAMYAAAQGLGENPDDPALASLRENPAFVSFNEELVSRQRALDAAQSQVKRLKPQADFAQAAFESTRDIDIPTLRDKGIPYAQRAQYAQQIGIIAQEGDNAVVEQLKASRQALANAYREGTVVQTELNRVAAGGVGAAGGLAAGSLAGEGAAGATATIAAATATAMRAGARDRAAVDDVVSSVGQSMAAQASAGARFIAGPEGVTDTFREQLRALSLGETGGLRGRFADSGLGQLYGGLQLRGGRAAGLTGGLEAFTTGNAPFAALIASQLIGSAVPGQVGSGISNVGGSLGTGALLGGLVGAPGLGLALGAYAGGQQLGGPFKSPVARGVLGAVIGRQAASLLLRTALGGRLAGGLAEGISGYLGGAGAAGAEGVAGGAAAGAAEAASLDATAAPLDLIPGVDVAVGAAQALILAGGTVGGALLGGLLGGSSPQQQAGDLSHASAQATQRALRTVAAAQRGVDPHGGFLTQFTNALQLGGSAGSSAQTQASAQIQQLQAEQLLFGPTSPQGRQAQSLASSAILSTIASAQSNPAAAQQLLQAADQARQTVISNQFKYQLQAGPPGSEFAAAGQAASQYRAETSPYKQAVTTAMGQVEEQRAELNQAIAAHDTKLIAQQRQALAGAQATLSAAQGIAKQEEETRQLNIQQTYQQAFQAASQVSQAHGALAQAQAGGNVIDQARAQARQAQTDINNARQLSIGDPRSGHAALQQAQANLLQDHTRIATQGLAELQAQGQVSEAAVFTGDPIAQAQVNLTNLKAQYDYLRQNSHAFDPSQIKAGLAAVLAAGQQLAQTISDYNETMIGLATQTAQARAYGDRIAQAAIGIQGATRELAAARTPQQHAQAVLQLAQAQAQQFDALSQSVTAQNQLAQARSSGDPVQQAALAVSGAQRLLSVAHGIDNIRQAEAQLAQAQYGYEQAIEQRYVDLGNLAASTTVDPVQQLRDQVHGLTRALSVATKPQDRTQLQTQLNNTKHQAEAAFIDQRDQTVNFQFQMMEITSAQAVSMLQGLLRVQGLTRQRRQSLLEEIRRYQLGQESPIGASGFDLAPGNIRLPTYYDVAHGISSRRSGGVTNHVFHTAPEINVYVKRGEDVPKVADAIDRATGGRMRARLRSAGVTA